MKNILLPLLFVTSLSCTDIDTISDTQIPDVSHASTDVVEFIIMPEVVIVANSGEGQEIIFTEEEVKGTFEDPTAYGAETFSALYVPSHSQAQQ